LTKILQFFPKSLSKQGEIGYDNAMFLHYLFQFRYIDSYCAVKDDIGAISILIPLTLPNDRSIGTSSTFDYRLVRNPLKITYSKQVKEEKLFLY